MNSEATINSKKYQDLFARDHNLGLLTNYRGQVRVNQTIGAEWVKFAIITVLWIGAAFGAGLVVPFLHLVILPALLAPFGLPELINQLLAFVVPIGTVLTFVPVNAMFLVLLERKLLALLTTRLGPNRVGFNGLFQTFADALKLLFKEDTTPTRSDKLLFFLAPALFFAPSVIAFLPLLSVLGGGLGPFAGTVFSSSLIFVFAVSSLAIMGLVMAGWASYNKYSLMGGLRSAAQAISYEVPLVLALVGYVLIVNSTDLLEIAQSQAGGLFSWKVFAGGKLASLGDAWGLIVTGSFLEGSLTLLSTLLLAVCFPLLAALVYFCTLAEVNRIPFDLPEAESELVSGFNTEFSGMKFALFFLAEYTNLFIVSMTLAVIFFGAGYIGIAGLDGLIQEIFTATPIGDLSWLVPALVLLIKTYLLVSVAIWIRATLPRFRSDQLMGLAWKVLIPSSLGLVMLLAFCTLFIN